MSSREITKTVNRRQFKGKGNGSCCNEAGSTSSISSCSQTSINVHNRRGSIAAKLPSTNTSSVIKEETPTKKSTNSTSLKTKEQDNNKSVPNVEPAVPAIGGKLSCSKCDGKAGEHTTRSNSLGDLRKKEKKKAVLLPSPIAESALSSTPSLFLNFENEDSDHSKRKIESLKEFNLNLRNNLFNQHGTFHQSPERAKEIFSLAPELSVSSEPIILKKRTYKYGILSLNNSTVSSPETDKNNAQNASEHDNSDPCYSGGEGSEISVSTEDSMSKKEVWASSVLLIDKPIRVKCINEATKKMNELIIYSDEFLADIIKQEDRMASRKQVFERLLRHCKDYEGKSLRMITDTKKFFGNLADNSESQGDVAWNSSLKATKQISQKTLNEAKIFNAPCRNKNIGNVTSEERPKKGKKSFLPKIFTRKNTACQTSKIKSTYSSSEVHKENSISNKKSEGKDSNKKENENCEEESGKKSRIAQKRINVEEIISSGFSQHFHFFAKCSKRFFRKSGVAISKNNSKFWLKTCGIISDNHSEKLADECFDAMASTKCILNISDYIQYLITFARKRHMILADVVQKLMNTDTQSVKKLIRESDANHPTDKDANHSTDKDANHSTDKVGQTPKPLKTKQRAKR